LQGPQGIPGKDGNTYEPQIGNVTTLEPEEQATASINVDVDQDIAYFNFGIPKGEKGDKGDTGNVEMATFDVVDGKLILHGTRQQEQFGDDYTFQLNDNKLEVVY
jgi:hypothetical protein